MQYRILGQTHQKVSLICLGTMTWGEQNSLSESHEQLDYAFERGINFIDTAEMYPVPPKAETFTRTEQYLGQWEKLQTHRDKLFIATKAVGPSSLAHLQKPQACFSREIIEKAVDDSLKRLNLDTIDLYQFHWPERSTNYFGQRGFHQMDNDEVITPIAERLYTIQKLIDKGKIRYLGLSNETPWGVMTYLKISEKENLPRVQSIQNSYNLLNRTFEIGNSEVSLREKVGLLAYSPLAFGVLTGKYLNGKKPDGARLTLYDRFTRYTNPRAEQASKKYCELATSLGLTPAHLALAFVNQQKFTTSNIIGATNLKQLKENIDSWEITISPETINIIEEIHNEIPNPCP